jgi:uncharacterized membrane protein (UPF0127 family)
VSPTRLDRRCSLFPTLSALALLALVLCGASTGCAGRQSDLPTTSVLLQGHRYELEIARTPAAREHGLMERDDMPSDHGMIFIFEKPDIYPFWMHHTRFALDILWLAADGQIVTIATMQPYVESSVPNTAPALYVIELHAGTAEKLGLHSGMKIDLPADVR